MKDQWYCGVDGQEYGPYTWDQLRAMAAEGRIVSATYVRRHIDKKWRSAAQIPGLLARKKAATKQHLPAAAAPREGALAGQREAGSAVVKTTVATPPAAAAAPAGSPSGLSVGQAVAVTAVETPLASQPPPVMNVPVGLAISTSVAKPAEAPGEQPATQPKRSPLLLVGVLGGLALAVAMIGTAVVAWSWSRSAQTAVPADVAAIDPPAKAEGPVPSAESNPGAAVAVLADKSPPGRAKSAGQSFPATTAAAKKVIAAQPRWMNQLRSPKITINSVSMQVTSVWLASDVAGTRVEPQLSAGQAAKEAAKEESAAQPATEATASSQPAATASAETAKYVFVEVRVANSAPVARRFASWNAAGPTAAVLASDAGGVLSPVPASTTPGVERLTSKQLAPGQSVFDILVFEAPTEPLESLKLALAKQSLAEGAKGHFAIEIPLEALFRKRQPLVVSQPLAETPLATSRAALSDQLSNSVPAIAEAAAPAEKSPTTVGGVASPSKGNKPPSVAELNRQFEEFEKSRSAKPTFPAKDDAQAAEAGANKPATQGKPPSVPARP